MGFFNQKSKIHVRESTAAELMVAFRQLGDALHERIRTLETGLRELREDHEALQAKHERLRGRVYGFGVHKEPAGPYIQSRDDLRRAAGIRAGQPFPHKE